MFYKKEFVTNYNAYSHVAIIRKNKTKIKATSRSIVVVEKKKTRESNVSLINCGYLINSNLAQTTKEINIIKRIEYFSILNVQKH
jgi:hypothetical protein